MTQEEAHADDVAEELKKKYNLSDEALAEVAEKLSIATPPAPRTEERSDHSSGGGLFGEMDDAELKRMQGMMGGGDISLSGVILLTEMWDRQDRRREERERRKDEEPAWAKRLGERVGVLETKLQTPPPSQPMTDSTSSKLYDELKGQLTELKNDNKELLGKLEKQAEEAKDEAQRQLIESRMNEVKGQIATLQSTIDGLKTPPVTPKDTLDQYIDAREKLIAKGILKEEKGSGVAARSREEVRAKGQDMILKHVDDAATNVAKTLEDIKNSVVIPRLRVESGVANTGSLSQKEREEYYKRLNLAQ